VWPFDTTVFADEDFEISAKTDQKEARNVAVPWCIQQLLPPQQTLPMQLKQQLVQ
jgi:hypothetical protein